MRAVAVRKFRTEPELMDLPKPSPASNEILVRMVAAGVNPFDWKVIDGALEGVMPHVFPMVVGVEGAGRVEEAGAHAKTRPPGSKIFGQLLHAPVGVGTWADYITVPDDHALGRVPDGVSFDEAAALSVSGLTGLGLMEVVDPKSGQLVLIVGASGGVGAFATQLAAARGATVVATARADAEEKVMRWGAVETVDPGRGPVAAQVRARHPGGLDGLIDVVSDAKGFAENASLVKKGGAAATTLGVADAAFARERGIRAVNFDNHPTSEKLDSLAAEVAAGRLTVPIESRRPLEEGPEALALLRAGRGRGKIVLEIETG
jgi:NADPH:quinone reductase-like Zn-dependent oxidoreductase